MSALHVTEALRRVGQYPLRSLPVFHHPGFMIPIGLGLITLHIGR
jgi:hypothetical protein